jgi:rod shape-determining protein MreD
MDVADASLLGQHALAYVLVAYIASSLSKRIISFSLEQQMLHVLPLLLAVPFIQMGVRVVFGANFPDFAYFVGPFVGTALWKPLAFILLLPQNQPVERDENRPV